VPRGTWELVAAKVQIDDGQGSNRTAKALGNIFEKEEKERAWLESKRLVETGLGSDSSEDGNNDDDSDAGGSDGCDSGGGSDTLDLLTRNVPIRFAVIVRADVNEKELLARLEKTQHDVSAVVAAISDFIGVLMYKVRIALLVFTILRVSSLIYLSRSRKVP
jgi:hypothetical protein